MTRSHVAKLFFATLFPYALCVEDTAMLIQRQRTWGAVEVNSGPVSSEELAPSLPRPGWLGVTLDRISTAGEDGSRIVLHLLGQYCTDGGESCAYFFGTPVRSWIEVVLAGGFNVGDILALSYKVDVESYNHSSFWAQFVPTSFALDEYCSLCEGTCTFKKVDAQQYFNLEMPTMFDGPDMCKSLELDEKPESFVFANVSVKWPFPPQDLRATVNTTLGLGILKSDGSPRAAASYLGRMTQEEPKGTTAMMMAAHKEEPPIGLPFLLGKMVFDTVQQGLEVVNFSSAPAKVSQMQSKNTPAEKTATPGHTLKVTLTVKEVESGTSLDFTAGDDCTKPDSVGSMTCTIPLGQVFNYSFAINSTASIEDGSTLRFKTYVNISGVPALIYGSFLPTEEINIPYCGNETVKTWYQGKEVEVLLPKCGDYKLEYMSLAPVPQFLADFENFLLPQVEGAPLIPITYNQLLPASYTMEAEVKHKDGTTIISSVLSFTMLNQL